MSSEFVVSIDLGTTKVSLLIGELNPSGEVRIIGTGSGPSDGVKKGVVVNIERAAECVRLAKSEAERMAGVEIAGVCAGVSGPHIKSFNSRGVVAIPTNRHEVNAKDVEHVTKAARSITLPYDREIINSVPQDFVVDNQGGIRDPVGMSAIRLEAEVHIVTGLRMPIENFVKVLKAADLELVDLVFEPLAAAQAVLTTEEMETGSLLVDMGGGVTSYAIYHSGCVRSSGVIAAGGANITSDLSIGLRTPASVAEDLKIKHGVALTTLHGEEESIEVPGVGGRRGQKVRKNIMAAIIEPRCEEIFTMVKKEVSTDPFYPMLGGGLVLTGGGSRIRGMDGVAEQVFDLPARTGHPRELEGLAEIVSDESWSAGVGLLFYERNNLMSRSEGRRSGSRLNWMVDGLRRIASLF